MVLFISTNDDLGGAAVVTMRLAMALRRRGIDARMLVGHKRSGYAWVDTLSSWRVAAAKVAERAQIFAHNGLTRRDLWKVSTGSFGAGVCSHPWVEDADMIVLGWVSQGVVSLSDLRRLCAMRKPLVWWMHDLWCATGICHIPTSASEGSDAIFGCERFREGCGDCPYLHWERRKADLSRRIWERKLRLFQTLPIHFWCVSNWQKEVCLSSSLLRGKRLEVLHHAFPIEDYAFSESVSSDSANKKLIVMGAARLDDPVKGLSMAIEALNLLITKHPDMADQVEAIFFGGLRDAGAIAGLKMSHRYVGPLADSDLQKLYRRADVVLSASLFETMGATLMEGMACGATPVTFGRGGQGDIVSHGADGYIAVYGSADSMADYLYKALTEPFDRQAQHASVAARFAGDRIAERFCRLTKQTCGIDLI